MYSCAEVIHFGKKFRNISNLRNKILGYLIAHNRDLNCYFWFDFNSYYEMKKILRYYMMEKKKKRKRKQFYIKKEDEGECSRWQVKNLSRKANWNVNGLKKYTKEKMAPLTIVLKLVNINEWFVCVFHYYFKWFLEF